MFPWVCVKMVSGLKRYYPHTHTHTHPRTHPRALHHRQASHLELFNTSYHWLWLGAADTAMVDFHLDKLNIGLNSEITLTIPRSADRDRYDVYDIWYV